MDLVGGGDVKAGAIDEVGCASQEGEIYVKIDTSWWPGTRFPVPFSELHHLEKDFVGMDRTKVQIESLKGEAPSGGYSKITGEMSIIGEIERCRTANILGGSG